MKIPKIITNFMVKKPTRKPVKKAPAKKVEKEQKPQAGTVTTGPKPEMKFPLYEGSRVVEVIDEKGDAKHCKMADGTTKWVPADRF